MLRNIIFTLLLFVFFLPVQASAQNEGIAIVVNDGLISTSDMRARMQLIIASSGLPDNPDTRKKLRPQVVSALIDEELQFQAADELELEVVQEDIDKAFSTIAQSNGLSPDEFKIVLKRNKADINSLYRQLEAQLLWNKVFSKSMVEDARVNEADIDAYIERLENNIGRDEYLLSEIFIPVENSKDESDIQFLAKRAVGDIRSNKVSFANVARQLSKAPGAQQGGALGWVQLNQLEENAARVIEGLSLKTVSEPIRTITGFHIYYLSNKRTITLDSIPEREQVRQQLTLERANRASIARLKDLRRSALIESRI